MKKTMKLLAIVVLSMLLVFSIGGIQVFAAVDSAGKPSTEPTPQPAGRTVYVTFAASAGAELVSWPSSVELEVYTSDDNITVFDEQQYVVLSSSLSVDQTSDILGSSATILPGVVVNSHFIHFDQEGTTTWARGVGEITFDGDIIGVITQDDSLDASDWLGLETTYPTDLVNRGLEQGVGRAFQDVIWITGDTLTVDLQALNVMDQIRVITEPDIDITATQDTDVNPIGAEHTVTATLTPSIDGVTVNFEVIAGPNTGASGTDVTVGGVATWSYISLDAGIDTIRVWIDRDMDSSFDAEVDTYDEIDKTWVDKYVEISGVIAGDLDNYGDKGMPTYTFQGWVGDAGGTAVGSITINYKELGVICTFTPDSGTFGIADAPSIDPDNVVDDERGDLKGWSFTCTNGDTGTANVYMLDRDAGAVLQGGFAPRGAIVVDIQTGDNDYQIGSTAPQWIPLDRGNIHVIDLSS